MARAEAVTGPFKVPAGDPRLNYSGARMAEILGIDRKMADALDLEQIIPPDLRREHGNARRRGKRVAAGGQGRDAYLAANTASRERPWTALGISRSTWYRRGLNGTGVGRTGPVPQRGPLGTPKARSEAPNAA